MDTESESKKKIVANKGKMRECDVRPQMRIANQIRTFFCWLKEKKKKKTKKGGFVWFFLLLFIVGSSKLASFIQYDRRLTWNDMTVLIRNITRIKVKVKDRQIKKKSDKSLARVFWLISFTFSPWEQMWLAIYRNANTIHQKHL